MFFIIWAIITVLTAILYIALVYDTYKRIRVYYNILGIKVPSTKTSIGAKIATTIKVVFCVACPVVHILYLCSFIFLYNEIVSKAVSKYVQLHKSEELELLKEKENEC